MADPEVEIAEGDNKQLSTSSDDDDLKKEFDEDRYEFDIDKFPVREMEFRLPGFKDMVAFNPLVSLIGVVFLWGVSIWCMGE